MYNHHHHLLYIFSTNYSPSNNELIVNKTKGLKVHFTTWRLPSVLHFGCIFMNLQTVRWLITIDDVLIYGFSSQQLNNNRWFLSLNSGGATP